VPPGFQLRPSGLGQRLPEAVQQKMEAFFGSRFDDVRVHVGNEASSIGALAFTIGTDLYFAPGQYNPQTLQGQQLLGHELTHVVQQRAGRVRNPMGTGLAVVQDPALEAEAERMGLRASMTATPSPAAAGPAIRGRTATATATAARPTPAAPLLPARATVPVPALPPPSAPAVGRAVLPAARPGPVAAPRPTFAGSTPIRRGSPFGAAFRAPAPAGRVSRPASAGATFRAFGRTIQRAWQERAYYVSNKERQLHVEYGEVIWGGTGGSGNHRDHIAAGRDRAILFETISTPDKVEDFFRRMNQAGSLWDIGLSVVLNNAYTPNRVYDARGDVTATPATLGNSLADVKRQLAQIRTDFARDWAGPPVQLVIAAWERHEEESADGNRLEIVASAVPYSTLRMLAATNAGARSIEVELRTNHAEFWRKMGDDDMPFVDPNPAVASPEIQGLADVEGEFPATNALVTFGYNLVTADVSPFIAGILRGIYGKEMELRERIAELGGPLYPSEPTTFYRPIAQDSMNAAWNAMEAVPTGGSGQQLEGMKLARALRAAGGGGMIHRHYHTRMVDTGAGHRNDRLVAELESMWNDGEGGVWPAPERIEARINELDQSALRHGEYVDKVMTRMGVVIGPGVKDSVEAEVTTYRKAAAAEAARTIRQALRDQLRRKKMRRRALARANAG
jgi:hypothetical protein